MIRAAVILVVLVIAGNVVRNVYRHYRRRRYAAECLAMLESTRKRGAE